MKLTKISFSILLIAGSLYITSASSCNQEELSGESICSSSFEITAYSPEGWHTDFLQREMARIQNLKHLFLVRASRVYDEKGDLFYTIDRGRKANDDSYTRMYYNCDGIVIESTSVRRTGERTDGDGNGGLLDKEVQVSSSEELWLNPDWASGF